MYNQITATLLFAAGVSAHGSLSSPTPRALGTSSGAMAAACGQQVWNMMSSDHNGNIQTMAQVGTSQSDFDAAACHLWQCRGYQFGDAEAASIQAYTAGQVIPMEATIAAPHDGVANVSIINLATNSIIGEPLISWDDYASTATGVTADETSFSVTMPDTLDAACATAGGCALQWWWDARSIDQTYMSCVDFTFGGATSSSSDSSSSDSSSSVAPASSSAAPAASSVAVAQAAAATAPASTTLATSVVPVATSSVAATVPVATPSVAATEASTDAGCSKKRKARRAALAAAAARRA